jgi:hypothetical protein
MLSTLHSDPKPEKLYTFLHARKYTMSFGAFEMDKPEGCRGVGLGSELSDRKDDFICSLRKY